MANVHGMAEAIYLLPSSRTALPLPSSSRTLSTLSSLVLFPPSSHLHADASALVGLRRIGPVRGQGSLRRLPACDQHARGLAERDGVEGVCIFSHFFFLFLVG